MRLRPTVRPWSALDLAAFCAPAIWTYVAVPFALVDPAIATTRELPGRRIAIEFAPSIRTHSRQQVLHLDDRMLIARHDYTAEGIGRWARASQQVTQHRSFGGVTVGAHRTVYPRRRDGRVRSTPKLVTVDIAQGPTEP